MNEPSPAFPSTAEMLGWIEAVVAQGVRRPGYPADRWAEQFVFDQFTALGLEAVRFEPLECAYWEDDHGGLSIESGSQREHVACFPVPFSQPASVSGRLVRWDPAHPEAVAGAIALYDLRFGSAPEEFPVWARRERGAADTAAPTALARAGWAYDPDGTFAEGRHRLPFPPEIQDTMGPAIAAGAIGFVGVLRNYPGGGCEYYVPYDGEFRPIPGVYVAEADGDRLAALVAEGPCEATVEVAAERGTTETRNVVGELPGADEEWLIFGTHHDGPWASAVEDGSGIAMLLAQARAWASVPAADRPHRLIFVATAAHMAHGAGTQSFIERHRAAMERTVLEIHLEHAARERPSADPGDSWQVTPRWWFTTERPLLEGVVWDAITTHGLDRSLVLTPDALAPFPTTDGGFFFPAGVPLVNYLAAPWYLFDPADKTEMVDPDTLTRVSRAVFDIAAATRGVSAARMRGLA